MLMRILVFLFSILSSGLAISQVAVVQVSNHNILYIEKDNYINVVVENHSCNEILIEANDCYISKAGDCQYSIRPKSLSSVEIKVYILNKNQKKLVYDNRIRVKRWPILEPTHAFSIGNNNLITVKELKQRASHGGLFYSTDPIVGCGIVRPKRFKYKFIRQGNIISEGQNNSITFDDEFLLKVNLLKPFDEILIYDIELKLPGYIMPFPLEPIKVYLIGEEQINFNSNLFYPEIGQQYWKDSTTINQVRYWDNRKINIKYENLKKNMKKRIEYDDSGNLIREAFVKQKLAVDTLNSYHPDTYENVIDIKSGYVDILNGPITEYFPYQSEIIIRLQGQYKENLKIGIWKACKETAPDKYECYEAEFKDDVMVGEIKKI